MLSRFVAGLKRKDKYLMRFDELDLKPEVMRGLTDMGFEELTPVQEETFKHVMGKRDMIARAETGSGKTAACGIPLVQMVDPKLNAVQGLIVVPTRELALQYVSVISDIAKHTKIAPFAVYGGHSIDIQRGKLDHGVHILVATPGRLIDLLYNTPLSLSEVHTFVLDEADEMLNMGFITDIDFIEQCLVHEHQTLLFSATMPKEVARLAGKYLNDPVMVELNVDKIAPQSLEHEFCQVDGKNHFDKLVEYMEREKPDQAIVFCNSRRNCEKLADKLRKKMDSVEMIHGGMEQSRRTSMFNRFKKKVVRIMVSTDIASRGLDFSHTSHVINYDFPMGKEAYTHRTGRTARMGRKGVALTFYSRGNLRDLKTILRINRIKPVWIGREPDLENIRKGGGGGYQGRGRSGGGQNRRKSSGPRRNSNNRGRGGSGGKKEG